MKFSKINESLIQRPRYIMSQCIANAIARNLTIYTTNLSKSLSLKMGIILFCLTFKRMRPAYDQVSLILLLRFRVLALKSRLARRLVRSSFAYIFHSVGIVVGVVAVFSCLRFRVTFVLLL